MQCYGLLIATSPLTLIGAGSDTKSENPPKKIVLSELQPVSSDRIHPWVFPLCWFWLINCLFILVLFGFVCFVCLFVTSLWGKEQAGKYSSAAGGCGTVHVVMVLSTGFFSYIRQKFAVPAQNVRMMTVSQRHFPSVAEL